MKASRRATCPSIKCFALAEELDIPIAIHMGTGGLGRANVAMPKFRGSMGNPLLLEELLARHPKLRVQVMHAGYPMIDNMLTLLQANSHVYVDVAGLIWSYPIKEVNRYIERLGRCRIRRPRNVWHRPVAVAEADGLLRSASFRMPITLHRSRSGTFFYNNAARFLRLDGSRTLPF